MKGTQKTHFKPTNIELLNILEARIVRDERCSFITDMQSLYEREPWLLQHVRHVTFKDNEWFYFVRRNKRPGMTADSKRPSRKVAESGMWKTTGMVIQVKNQDGVIVGCRKNISFKADCDTVKDGITTGWTMHEFILDRPWFQEVVLCRIRFFKRKDNAQYAPRFLPIVIGREREDSIHHGVAAADEELQYVDAPVETHQDQGMEQWTGSCSHEVASYLASQQIRAQDLNYPMLNGGMMQHQDFGQYGQGLGQETTDSLQVPMMMSQTFNDRQQWNGYSGSSSANQDMAPVTQDMAVQGQQLSVNGSMEQHQDSGSFGQVSGKLLGQQQNHIRGGQASSVSLMGDHQQQCQNLFGGHVTDPSHSAQAKEQQQELNGYFGQYSVQPYDQGMMENHDFGSSALGFGQNNDLSAPIELVSQQKDLGEDSNLSLTQQQNQTVPTKTQQLQRGSVTDQLHTEAQDNVPLINQTMEAQATGLPANQGIDESHGGIVGSPTFSQLYQELLGEEEMDSEMDDIRNDFLNEEWVQKLGKNTPEEEAELMDDSTNCETFESFLDSLLSK
ncbi:NAC domain-containing protein [Raphanus sativus]|uniref:Uncharacterized protein LOC130499900 n=1 Tax=Raphanus sativus TaxID=3726 RepID=A0A9W3CG33_RAPSA|nr:uncharacterized protein LOC130499900 [Raphanus sativus]KAJ4876627.1 NAC domain-containing protein [Raphanus sativus]